jgi:hypothetical protein
MELNKKEEAKWTNTDLGFNEEKSSFKKKRKYVYLEKYEETITDLRKDIVSLKKVNKVVITLLVFTIALLGLTISCL